MLPRITMLLLILALATPSAGAAGDVTGNDRDALSLLRTLQAHMGGLDDFRAAFVQRLHSPRGEAVREEQGVLYIRLPDRMRWNYLKPEPKEFICDGERVWFHEPEEQVVTIYSAATIDESGTPLLLLLGQGDLEKEFLISPDRETAATAEGGVTVLARPLSDDAPFIEARLEVVPGPAPRLVRLLVVDPLQNTTEYRFSDFRENSGLAADYFTFTPPPGTEVWQQGAK